MTNAEIEKIIVKAVTSAIDKTSKNAEERTKQYIGAISKESDERMKQYVGTTSKESDERMQQYITRLTKESDERMEQYIGAISEQSKHQIEAVGEQYAGLNEKVDRVEALGNATFEEVGIMRVELTVALETQKDHEKRITAVEQKVR